MNISISPREIFRLNLLLILFLLCANTVALVAKHYLAANGDYYLIKLFDFSAENNIPTFYSAVALLFSSILLSLISSIGRKTGLAYSSWLTLSLVFLFLSIDEITSIHERLTEPVREVLPTSGLLFYAWIIPYSIGLVVFIIAYSRFLLSLPKNIAILFLTSGATFTSGAVGLEMLGGRHAYLFGTDNVLYSIFSTSEEFLEMLGIAMFNYALLLHMVNQFNLVTVTVSENR